MLLTIRFTQTPHLCKFTLQALTKYFRNNYFSLIGSFKIKCAVSYFYKISSLLNYPYPAGQMLWDKFAHGQTSCKSHWSPVINWWLSVLHYMWQYKLLGVREKKVAPRMYTRESYKMIKDKNIFYLNAVRVTDTTHTCKHSCIAMLPFRIIPLLVLGYFHSIYNVYT